MVSGAGVVSTGLQISKNSLYSLRFKGLCVGNKKGSTILTNLFNSSSSKIFGFLADGITLDSGTILTHFPRKYYDPLESAMKREIKLEVAADPNQLLKLCYKTADSKIKAPLVNVTVHFVGADVKLNPINTFVKVAKDVQCLVFVPHDGRAILGNLAQINFLVG